MSSQLSERTCRACEGGLPPLVAEEIKTLMSQISGWGVVDSKKIEKEWKFNDFRTALIFVNQIGELAEKEGHHPDIELGWGRVKVTLWTHAVKGLSENDFILAAKIDQLSST